MHGVNEVSSSVEIGGSIIRFSTGKYAKQSDAAVVVSCGDSSVLCTVVSSHVPSPFDFLPLTVEYQDRDGSRGAIPGGFLKREGRGNERTTLISRLIDRPIRPLFPKNYPYETQIIATVLSFDNNVESDWLSLCGSAAAVHVSNVPMSEAAAGVRICQVDGKLVINPNAEDRARATLNIVVAGTAEAVIMVEGGAHELSEDVMLDALELGHDAIKKIVGAINELRALTGNVEKRALKPAPEVPARAIEVAASFKDALAQAQSIPGKHERRGAIKAVADLVKAAVVEGVSDEAEAKALAAAAAEQLSKLEKKLMRARVVNDGVRVDGRATNQIRPIWCEVGVAPRAHGSAVFTRGETQGFVTAALGTERDNQRIDWPGAASPIRNWMLTYNFPPFCTGEVQQLRAPKRREVGHGALAHRALEPVLPSFEDFPYVLRCTSDILESNGSSSMATVCGSTLSLMDAGVPIKAPVAGIAMGLIKEGDKFAVLSDILGDEDHLGDMDFKVTGTRAGITAFQMDTKIAGVSREIMAKALEQARQGRVHILDEMAKAIPASRTELSQWAPRITTIQVKPDRIREIIGPGGKVIRGIQDKTGTTLNIDDSGRVLIAATSQEAADKAIGMIRELTQEAEIGKLYLGVVKRIVDFGAFVEIFPGTDGLIHISHLAAERVNKVTDVLNEGDEVLVRVIDVDKSGKIRLSRKEALEAGGGY